MPRSHGVLKVEVWEPVNGFRQLTLDGQWCYAMLISQPQINNLGVLPYVPEKWVRFASGLDARRLVAALDELRRHAYIVIDTDTGELLVRTFVRHDGVWKIPKLVTNARRLWRETESNGIRSYLATRHPWLLETSWDKTQIEEYETSRQNAETPSVTPTHTGTETPTNNPGKPQVTEPVQKPLTEPVTEPGSPPRARAQDGLPQPQGLPQGLTPLARSEGFTRPPARDTTTEQPQDMTTIENIVETSLRLAAGDR